MTDLLTSRQVQEILKVDRITVYRMLQDGRLKGVKIGQQWRFSQRDVERLLGARPVIDDAPPPAADGSFPTHCVQTIQDLFAEVGQASALVVNMQGRPLTQPSRPQPFCALLLDTPSGSQAAQADWLRFAAESQNGGRFFTCSFGLQYTGAPVFEKDTQVALFLTGPFYWQPPNPREEQDRIRRLSAAHQIPLEALAEAARAVPVIAAEMHERVESWPRTAARAVESILNERISFLDRLQQIASLTQLA